MYVSAIEKRRGAGMDGSFYLAQGEEEELKSLEKAAAGTKEAEKKEKEPEKPAWQKAVEAGATAAAAIATTAITKGRKIEPVPPGDEETAAARRFAAGEGLPEKTFMQKYGVMIGVGAAAIGVPTLLYFLLRKPA